ncbi:DEAD/DEAH box helicase [Candidatus Methylomirabilis limnetica]|uniref:DEAD/DEAH box helicase n=1 Tax=Candidatus Methylomirabilis limnetica TaxID=2033718 RepID=UPI003D77D0D6
MENIRQTVKRVWGYDTLLPLQEEAMRAVLARRDSIVILPTGGGKSLCFQAPAAAAMRTCSRCSVSSVGPWPQSEVSHPTSSSATPACVR